MRICLAIVCGLTLLGTSPAFAQSDIAGDWAGRGQEDQGERGAGPALGDYTGLPLNEAGRFKASAWDASILTLPEHQAKPHPSTYSLWGPGQLKVVKHLDRDTLRVVSYEMFGMFGRADRTIWMDGRAHPPAYAPHTWAGFSTGRWEGDTLKVVTTHLKTGWIRRNGAAHSDQATLVEYWTRHRDMLIVTQFISDAVFFEEPFIRTITFALNERANPNGVNAFGGFRSGGGFEVVDEIAGRDRGYVPHYLPSNTAHLREFAEKVGLPTVATLGGAETMYPEFQMKLGPAR